MRPPGAMSQSSNSGNTNVKWLVDLAAISMIFLTITGIILSIKTLRAQGKQRRKRRVLEA